MNRRSFLKFLPAGVIGAKQAAVEAAEKLALDGVSGSMNLRGSPVSSAGSVGIGNDWARANLKRLVDPEWIAYRKQQVAVGALDADLAMMKSIALGRRIDMQRDRNFQRETDRERSYLEKTIAGFFD